MFDMNFNIYAMANPVTDDDKIVLLQELIRELEEINIQVNACIEEKLK